MSKDVVFSDLGLMIIDEERFVLHKETLERTKNKRCPNFDSNANPCTLHMSMLGIRDLSVIETPQPIVIQQTYVLKEW